jgi:hypothetical protein
MAGRKARRVQPKPVVDRNQRITNLIVETTTQLDTSFVEPRLPRGSNPRGESNAVIREFDPRSSGRKPSRKYDPRWKCILCKNIYTQQNFANHGGVCQGLKNKVDTLPKVFQVIEPRSCRRNWAQLNVSKNERSSISHLSYSQVAQELAQKQQEERQRALAEEERQKRLVRQAEQRAAWLRKQGLTVWNSFTSTSISDFCLRKESLREGLQLRTIHGRKAVPVIK